MNVRKIPMPIKKNLSISTLIGSYLIYVDNRNICMSQLENCCDVIQLINAPNTNKLINLKNKLVVVQGSKLTIYALNKTELTLREEHYLIDIPVKIISSDDALLALFHKGPLQIIRNNNIESVPFIKNLKVSICDTFIDIFIYGIDCYLLSDSGNVYKLYSPLITGQVILKKPMKIIPEPTTFLSEQPSQVGVNGKNLFICYKTGFEVYKINGDILYLEYTYKRNDCRLYFYNHVFCAEDQFLVANKAPCLLINDKIQNCYLSVTGEYIAIGPSALYYITEGEDKKINTKGIELVKKKSVDEQVEDLFKNITYSIPCLTEEDLSEKYILKVEQHINTFRILCLDKIKAVQLELKSINDSLDKKVEIIDKNSNELLEKVKIIDNKKMKLYEKLKNINKRMDKLINLKCSNDPVIATRIKLIESKMKNIPRGRFGKYLDILKIQKQILTSKVNMWI
ncbi:hypothetical protein TCON_1409 [Astathelohania contejeani]|uniref:Uncharacterized protein n=1 Tax=Astathelohania contejeani TaxID=164912 RepID=A0ABQ7HYW6_9MICR|nr:hypothetical protein TCON_1409 [Thelohania contejeani]